MGSSGPIQPSAFLLGLVEHNEEEIIKPFIVGTVAQLLPEDQKTEEKTHKWTVYLRGLQNEDLSYFISYVVFHLHYSFKDADRSKTLFIWNILVEFMLKSCLDQR